MIKIFNENCFITMKKSIAAHSLDIILTSPPYNTNRRAGFNRNLLNNNTKGYPDVRYDQAIDIMSDDEYCSFTINLFNCFDNILKTDGCVLYNISYGTENTEGMFLAINSILTNTNFTIADTIVWKKFSAIPNNVSSNKLTRICEFVFVFCRKSEFNTFYCNKRIKSKMPSGQPVYENKFNYIEAPNNNGVCPYNKATYSVELCEQLLKLYAPNDAIVYDPFMGSGTTAVACKYLNFSCYGSELSENQCEFAENRLNNNGIIKKSMNNNSKKLF